MSIIFPYKVPTSLPSDPVLAEFIPEFAAMWIIELDDALANPFESSEYDRLYRLGHTIKGSFLQFGFPELSPGGVEIMEFAKAGQYDAIRIYVMGFRDLCRELEML